MGFLARLIPENCRNWSFLFPLLLALSLIPALGAAILRQNFETVGLSLAALFFILAPFVLQARLNFYMPRVFSFGLALFVYATLFLGEVNRFYYDVWWWDIMLHSSSGFAFGLIGLILILLFLRSRKIIEQPLLVAVLAFSFAQAIGVLWEIFEFTGDQLLGTDMQKSGLIDTMWDLIVNVVGAFIAALIGYFYVHPKADNTPLESVLDQVVKENA